MCIRDRDAMSCVAIGTGKALENYDKNSFAYNAITEYRRGDYLNV